MSENQTAVFMGIDVRAVANVITFALQKAHHVVLPAPIYKLAAAHSGIESVWPVE